MLKKIIPSCVLMIVALVLFISARSIPENSAEPLGPQFFPTLISCSLFILSFLQLIIELLTKTESGYENVWSNPRLYASILLLLLISLNLNYVGFVISAMIFLFLQITILYGWKDLLRNKVALSTSVLISLIIPIMTNAIFYHCLNVILPRGLWGGF